MVGLFKDGEISRPAPQPNPPSETRTSDEASAQGRTLLLALGAAPGSRLQGKATETKKIPPLRRDCLLTQESQDLPHTERQTYTEAIN